MNASTIHFLEAEYNSGLDPEDFEPLPFECEPCFCGDFRHHFECNPVTCLEASWDIFNESRTDLYF